MRELTTAEMKIVAGGAWASGLSQGSNSSASYRDSSSGGGVTAGDVGAAIGGVVGAAACFFAPVPFTKHPVVLTACVGAGALVGKAVGATDFSSLHGPASNAIWATGQAPIGSWDGAL